MNKYHIYLIKILKIEIDTFSLYYLNTIEKEKKKMHIKIDNIDIHLYSI